MKTYADLLALAEAAPICEPATPEEMAKLWPFYAPPPRDTGISGPAGESGSPSSDSASSPSSPLPEADDDPHRLARINLERYGYATEVDGRRGTIRFWRGEFYTWKPDRGCYRIIEDEELRSKISASVKTEFDRISRDKIERSRDSDSDDPRPQKVTKTLITNVVEATKSITLIPSSTELGSWIDQQSGQRRRRNYIALQNGILDLDRLLENNEDDSLSDVLLDPSPEWFSTVRLPYDFDLTAACPKFEAFLERSLEMDPERIKVLQEWAGYLLLPDTSYQKFLALEGEGSNGKSVYFAAMTAMLGLENCSYCSIEQLSDKFSRTQSLGRLANICPDVSEKNEKASEGDIKSFTSGDVMFFDRKHKTGLNCIPSARLMMSWNNRPRWIDKSDGLWRRMILIPFQVRISDEDRIIGMDKHPWWIDSGELPGILNWAIEGLSRLRNQKRFTETEVGKKAIEDYKSEANPARSFLLEHLEIAENNNGSPVRTALLYRIYRKWAEANGYKPLGERMFGKEVKRTFPNSERVRRGPRGDQFGCYSGISFMEKEICGIKTEEELF